ncbi:MAG TPA: class I SAM-dependent methyltransferase [Kiloniellales bacterium]|nr:class I SAM-dependent methyltransferase [Kiloniellales bacterium]
MSRLDSAIRRLEAQRACIDRAAALVADLPGPVLELGLGNGRTYDHLRKLFPEREIFVFDRQVAAHPDCVPDEAHLVLGDIETTLPAFAERFANRVALVHSDIGTGEDETNRRIAGLIAQQLPRLLCRGGLAVSDQPLEFADASRLPPPEGVKPNRYFTYRLD